MRQPRASLVASVAISRRLVCRQAGGVEDIGVKILPRNAAARAVVVENVFVDKFDIFFCACVVVEHYKSRCLFFKLQQLLLWVAKVGNVYFFTRKASWGASPWKTAI